MSTEEDPTELAPPREARRQVGDLVDRFARNGEVYTRPECKETHVRVERMLDLHKKLAAGHHPRQQEPLPAPD